MSPLWEEKISGKPIK